MQTADRPRFPLEIAAVLAEELYGVTGTCEALASERDQNVLLRGEHPWVLKISHPDESPEALDLQRAALELLRGSYQAHLYPSLRPTLDGRSLPVLDVQEGHFTLRLVAYLPGAPLATVGERSDGLLADLGRRCGGLVGDLSNFAHAGMHHSLAWDPKRAFTTIRARLAAIEAPADQLLIRRVVDDCEARLLPLLPSLPMQVIHGDLNDHNVLVEGQRVSGLIDFGDMLHAYRICELAHLLAYLLLGHEERGRAAGLVLEGYRQVQEPTVEELLAAPDFLRLRLALSATMAAHQRSLDPSNEYLSISEAPVWQLLRALDAGGEAQLRDVFQPRVRSCVPERSIPELIELRGQVLSRTLSTAYDEPLKIVRGAGAYLFDAAGERYLDCVNNVCHVGHSHPRVVAALARQAALLNTNTRYLHDNLPEYARRLTSLFPAPLEVCFLVNSGSEANELAQRLARAHTRAEDFVVLEHAYHGNTQGNIDVSPYKFDGRGGAGAPASTHKVPMPDRYRGPYGYDDAQAGRKYAAAVGESISRLASEGRPLAGFLAESILGVGGQVELPTGFLETAYEAVRAAGGVCIADEVQVGFGRVGDAWWAFEGQGVVPDIVTLGKPIGNGHPLAAVITTAAIARSFETGMEYFNTFGGNPVSCAVGLAVLDVIEDEGLLARAAEVGAYLLARFHELAARHALVGDVRGRGLFLGLELVLDRGTKQPATAAARELVQRMRGLGVLLSTDGPFECVVKLKPPLAFGLHDADELVEKLDLVLGELAAGSPCTTPK
ncbi:MAG: aminotransferase class III-fold pyridoxal phosphate-dependent enzyme [Planctomycetota bacterium]|nr:aminotransferase class III-fold pyridoxal phosphate-dependent enzyme [Planctomycetota bacterium]